MSTAVFLYQAAIVGSVWWLTWGQGFVGYLLALIFWSAFTFFRAMTPKLKLIQGTVILASAAVFAEAAYIDLLLTVEKHGIFVVVGISFVATVVLTLAFNWLSGVVYANMAKRIDDVHDFAESPRFNYENVKEVVKSGTLSACGISDVLDTRAPVYLKVPFGEKDEVRELGAKWDPSRREWYMPPGMDIREFEKWMPKEADLRSLLLKRVQREGVEPKFIGHFDGVDSLPRDLEYPAVYYWVDKTSGDMKVSFNRPLLGRWCTEEARKAGFIAEHHSVEQAILFYSDFVRNALQKLAADIEDTQR